MLKAVIFDMDGLLIDSEPIWQKSEIEIFKKVNVDLTKEMCMQTMGLRLDQVINHWHDKFGWNTVSKVELEEEIINRVIHYILEEGNAMEGVLYILEFFKMKNFKIALASSSCFKIIHTVIQKLKIEEYFNLIHSAELEEYGKPHPGIYINTAKALQTSPTQCIAFEDSLNGMIAAKAARMKIVAVPDSSYFNQSRFDFTDLKIEKLSDFNEAKFVQLNIDY